MSILLQKAEASFGKILNKTPNLISDIYEKDEY